MKQPWKNTSPCYGFLLLGHWPQQSAATCAQKENHTTKNPTHIQILQKVFRHHLSHHDRSAGRQWCWLSSKVFINISITVLLWPRKTLGTSGYSWLLLCQKVPQYSFSLSLCLSAQCFCFVSQKCSISLAVWPLLLRVLICPPSTADSAVLSLFSSPMEHVLSTINIGRLCAKSRSPKLDSSLKRMWSASRDASQHRL